MLTTIHLKTLQLGKTWTSAALESTALRLAGVARVAAVASAGVVSIMFDDSVTNAERIVSALRRRGISAKVVG